MPHLGWFDDSKGEQHPTPPTGVGDYLVGCSMLLAILSLLGLAFWK